MQDEVREKLKELVDKHGSWRRVAEHLKVHPAKIQDILAGLEIPDEAFKRKLGL